eukprot:UN26626
MTGSCFCFFSFFEDTFLIFFGKRVFTLLKCLNFNRVNADDDFIMVVFGQILCIDRWSFNIFLLLIRPQEKILYSVLFYLSYVELQLKHIV